MSFRYLCIVIPTLCVSAVIICRKNLSIYTAKALRPLRDKALRYASGKGGDAEKAEANENEPENHGIESIGFVGVHMSIDRADSMQPQ